MYMVHGIWWLYVQVYVCAGGCVCRCKGRVAQVEVQALPLFSCDCD